MKRYIHTEFKNDFCCRNLNKNLKVKKEKRNPMVKN